jgi:hypothetical protein
MDVRCSMRAISSRQRMRILCREWIEEAPLNSAAQRGSLDLVHLGLCQRWNGGTLEIH